MKEEKICSFTHTGYRLQLLKITETNINGYYQIRENRRIKATFTTLDAAIKKFYALQGSKILQKDIFSEEKEYTPTQENVLEICNSVSGWHAIIEMEDKTTRTIRIGNEEKKRLCKKLVKDNENYYFRRRI